MTVQRTVRWGRGNQPATLRPTRRRWRVAMRPQGPQLHWVHTKPSVQLVDLPRGAV